MENDNTHSEKSPASEAESAERDADFSSLEAHETGIEGAEGESTQEESNPQFARLRAELAETNDKYLRALADLENYKKRALKERSDLLKYQGEKAFYDLLEVVDNLEFALQFTGLNLSSSGDASASTSESESKSQESAEKLRQGLVLIHKLFLNILGKWEVRPDSALGKPFDPQRFSAISKVKSPDAVPGTVISELKKAYFYKDKLLRPGEVVVAEATEDCNHGGDPDQGEGQGTHQSADTATESTNEDG